MIHRILHIIAIIFTINACFAKGPYYKNFSELPQELQNEVLQWGASKPFQIVVDSCGWTGTIDYLHDDEKLSVHDNGDVTYYAIANKIVVNIENKRFNKTYQLEITREDVRLEAGEQFEQFNVYTPYIKMLTNDYIIINTAIAKLDTDIGDSVDIIIDRKGIRTQNECTLPL